ncbi:MAG: biotin-dependent carboxyltransferase family protein, partial [Proteobacteria bacterium]|nr:biotin-dependent carboxyltransferase family protein [Pseudomonadota bacterium]
MTALKICAPGGFTTVQDRGRFGFQQMGVPVSGALDLSAFRLANLLVGNDDTCAGLEITVMGPKIEILKEMDIALTGAKMAMTLNDQPVEQWTSIRVRPKDILTISMVQQGCRAYLAVSGGIKVPRIMGSYATYVGGKIGGFMGRPLQQGDILETHDAALLKTPRLLPPEDIPEYPAQALIRVLWGPQDHYFDVDPPPLLGTPYMVTTKADRMGYRLQGSAVPIKKNMPKSIVSEPAMPGSIQIPPDGQPIILLVEQTVGGYAKIATVISTDLPRVAQTTPGDRVQFEKIDLESAHRLHRE